MIYHMISQAAWDAAQAAGVVTNDSLARDGFIHCSQRHQVAPVASAYFNGQRDILVLRIDPARLTAELRYEPPQHLKGLPEPSTKEDDMFPHIYGEISLSAVIDAVPLILHPDGSLTLPDGA
ncbi:MAG TPA: DUF952 domain-containing protein [Aggregatilineales bacterium]|nr:DUF952 domain-containing protein [Anaerolineales bacterium]HRE46789.1 DUF952 domain-containing protein [Aggregatilineales bacterium]